MEPKRFLPGLTPVSLLATLFALLLSGMLIQYSEIIVGIPFPAEHTLAIPAIWAFLVVTLVSALFYGLTRIRILSRQEMLCVVFATLIAAPLMTQGFWHRLVAITATNPRMADFNKMDAFNDKLWPHGRNLLQDAFAESRRGEIETTGSVAWIETEYEEGARTRLPVLVNTNKDDRAVLRVRLPLQREGAPLLVQGEPYMVSVLARATDLGPSSTYYTHVYDDNAATHTEFFRSAAVHKPNYLHRRGFGRVGAYGVKFTPAARDHVTLEFGLDGYGKVELWDPQLYSVAALEAIYKGKKVVTESEFRGLPPEQRANLLVKPDRMWSLKGLGFILAGYIPVRDWLVPMATWTSFVLLVLVGSFAVNILIRKQWMESERFQLPVARIPVALMDDEGHERAALPPIWKNKLMWIGLAATLAWELLKAWHFYNPKVYDLSVFVPLRDYMSSPNWGAMWDRMRFEVFSIFLAIGIFMELNVLLSLVAGLFLFRLQYWIGHLLELDVNPNYPWAFHQGLGAYLGYALMVLFFARKYLARVFKAAIQGGRDATPPGEALSYRAALILLLLTFVGAAVWARTLGITVFGMLIFFLLLLTIGFVACRIRTECGTPWGYIVPGNLAAFMVIIGGVRAFGPEAILFCYVASFMVSPTVFFLIPGAQMEMIEWGRRWHVTPRHLFWAGLVGVLGGMVVGGWVFLSNSYALGGETSPYGWAYDTKWWYFFSYNQEMTKASNALLGAADQPAAGMDPGWWAFGLSAGVTMLLTALRQVFAGFWFHPIGFMLGSTVGGFIEYVWGSLLAAWVIRFVVLKLGGAVTVREKLQPIFVGVFVGAALAYLCLGAHAVYLKSVGIDKIYPILTPP